MCEYLIGNHSVICDFPFVNKFTLVITDSLRKDQLYSVSNCFGENLYKHIAKGYDYEVNRFSGVIIFRN